MSDFIPPSITIPATFFPEVGSKFRDYTVVKSLGSGGFGYVYLVEGENKEKFALKLISIKRGELSKEVIREISLLYDTNHENIVRLKTVFVEGENLCLIMEFLEADLEDESFPLESDADVREWMYQIVCAVAYLHDRNIIHRDLKPNNILKTKNGNLKLADFGLSQGFLFPGEQITPLEATPEFSAPEILLGSREYGTAIDMWSIGCIFALMIQGENPFFNHESLAAHLFQTSSPLGHVMPNLVLNNIFRKLGTPDDSSWAGVTDLPNYPTGGEVYKMAELDVLTSFDEEGKDLLRKLLIVNPNNRISAKEAVNHPYFRSMKKL